MFTRGRSGWVLSLIVAGVFFTCSTDAQTGSRTVPSGQDYIIPTAEMLRQDRIQFKGRRSLLATAGGPDSYEEVIYTAFSGIKYPLRLYRGKYVAILVAASWLEPVGELTHDNRRWFTDNADKMYESYKTVLGAEPEGEGLLPIALGVPNCGACCGYIGHKGLEIDSRASDLQREISEDQSFCLQHEMGHNFDLHSNRLLPGHGHVWTSFFVDLATSWSRVRSYKRGFSPEDYLRSVLEDDYTPWITTPEHSWKTCLEERKCEGFQGDLEEYVLRFPMKKGFQLHGLDQLPEFFSRLRDYGRTHTMPSTREERADLEIETMADTFGADLACYVDQWKWHLSEQARARMAARFTSRGRGCADSDRDGFSPLQRDEDDSNPATYPGAREIREDGKDNDGNGLIDELVIVEGQGQDLPGTTPLTMPAEIRANLTLSAPDGPSGTARLANATGVAIDPSGRAYITDLATNTVREIFPDGAVRTHAGSGKLGSADGPGTAAEFRLAWTLEGGLPCTDRFGNLYVPDGVNRVVRRIFPDGRVETYAGQNGQVGDTDGRRSEARFRGPQAVAADAAGNVFVVDWDSHVIRKIAADGTVSTLAGKPGDAGATDGKGDAARFDRPAGVAVDGAGNAYVTCSASHTVRRVAPDGTVTTLAGSAYHAGAVDGRGSSARFNEPFGIAVSGAGEITVTDRQNRTVRRISAGGDVITIAGKAGESGSKDGKGEGARFEFPLGIALAPSGTLLVVDLGAAVVNKIVGDEVSLIAGKRYDRGFRDTDTFSFEVSKPERIAFQFISDPDFQGWLFLNKPQGGWHGYTFLGRGGRSLAEHDVTPGRWTFDVAFNSVSLPGSYKVLISEAKTPWPQGWGESAEALLMGPFVQFKTRFFRTAGLLRAPKEIRFWVSTRGWVGRVPFAEDATFVWPVPADLPPGTYGYRAQLFDGETPVSEELPPRWFRIVADGQPSAATFELPVVLDVLGVAPAHYTSDLVLANGGVRDSEASILFRPSDGSLQPLVRQVVPAGRVVHLPDVIAFLRVQGLQLESPGTVGSLLVGFQGDGVTRSTAFAGSRTSTLNPNAAVGGRFGLFSAARQLETSGPSETVIAGLREDSLFRSNLAVVDLPGGSGPPELSVQLFDGDKGQAAGEPIRIALKAGEWRQLTSVLAQRGVHNGWARITRVGGGSNPYHAYGVVNDGSAAGGGTSDGSLLEPGASPGLLPAVLKASSGSILYKSELVLTNTLSTEVTVRLTFTPAPQFGGGPSASGSLSMAAQTQLRISDAITYLRDTLKLPLGDPTGNLAGTLLVEGASAQVRTSNPNPDASVGGSFGVAYPAYPKTARAGKEAWIYGLRQDGENRSNVAIADARVSDQRLVNYSVEVFDGMNGDGTSPRAVFGPFPLSGGQWWQVDGVLGRAGLTAGYVRVRADANSDFVAYGVLNDGGLPGLGTSDGSYVPMVALDTPPGF